eukprot:Skav215145  [mRNA]  locus=scaffold809:214766:218312:+ [translate_table: standard]
MRSRGHLFDLQKRETSVRCTLGLLRAPSVTLKQFLVPKAFQCEGMPPGEDGFPRADTDIIKSEDIVAALPVPRSSSEVVKPSELFLDLMMLDPLKTKEVSQMPKPSTHTEVPSAQMVAQTATDSKCLGVPRSFGKVRPGEAW